MTTVPLVIKVDPQAARAFNAVSPDVRRKLEALLSLRLMEATRTPESLTTMMREISRVAQARGLTQEILNDILADDGT